MPRHKANRRTLTEGLKWWRAGGHKSVVIPLINHNKMIYKFRKLPFLNYLLVSSSSISSLADNLHIGKECLLLLTGARKREHNQVLLSLSSLIYSHSKTIEKAYRDCNYGKRSYYPELLSLKQVLAANTKAYCV